MKKSILIIFLFIVSNLFAQNDSIKILTLPQFLSIVKTYHPIVKQAFIQTQKGDAMVLNARGNFDPKLYTNINHKYFDEKSYFNLFDAGVKIPTWFGIEAKSGYERNQGMYLNPENNTPYSGLWYAGISLPLIQGLITDERRTVLYQAKIYRSLTYAEKDVFINELLFNAGKAYWDWFIAYNNQLIYENAVTVAQERFQGIKQAAFLGDRPFIDTLEAAIQLQERMINSQQAKLEYQNKKLILSTYLWYKNDLPFELPELVTPVLYYEAKINQQFFVETQLVFDSLINAHPMIKSYQFKIENLLIDKKWKQEKLKPILNLSYNLLKTPAQDNFFSNYVFNNYKWALTFNAPILLRKERGDLKLANFKIRELQLDLKNKTVELITKSKASVNEYIISKEQVDLYTKTVSHYESLLDAEKQIFEIGESSLFMINSREISFINAKIKLIDLIAKNHKALLAADYALGKLINQ